MTDTTDDWIDPLDSHPRRYAIGRALHEFIEGVKFKAWDLAEGDDYDGRAPMWPPLAWVCAAFKGLGYFTNKHNLERMFCPLRAERRQRIDDISQGVFWGGWGVGGNADALWAESEALLKEFPRYRQHIPPRDFEAMSVAEAVGQGMGYSREEVADILGKDPSLKLVDGVIQDDEGTPF